MDLGIRGKTAIVTGGAKGIGRHYSQALASEGARVMIADIADGRELAEEIARRHGADCVASAKCDVSDEKAVKATLEDDKATKALNDRMDLYLSRDKITGTPTFFVGGARFDGEQTLAQLDTAIVAAEAKAGKPWRGAARPKRKHT